MATNTYVALDKITVSGTSTSSVTFNSIPQGYTDLVLEIQATADSGNPDSRIKFNGNTSNNMSGTILTGNGTSASSARRSNLIQMEIDWTGMGTGIGQYQINIMNYANTTTYKTFLVRSAFAAKGTDAIVGLWSNTAAINSITIDIPAGNYVAGSTFTIYGIAADNGTYSAKATGGTITADQFNVIHTFTSSGTFTPTEGLVVDYLVIAGGGAGGNGNGGAAGGGAGGYVTSVGLSGGGGAQGSPLSVSSGTAYTVTVGQGGVGGTGVGSIGTNGTNSTFSTITAIGGGLGGSYPELGQGSVYGKGWNGGSGGGSIGMGGTIAGALGTSGQGCAGGSGSTDEATYRSAGGGGGAGAVGVNGPANNSSGAGGAGLASTISGTSVTRAGGGGGSQGTDSAGGPGGGGAGGDTGTAGTINTGSGGGGGTWGGSGGGNGGSGIVIIRYAK
jgi:hypothetical protein